MLMSLHTTNAICHAWTYQQGNTNCLEGREITLTDTVGFIQKLPTTFVEAFKYTLMKSPAWI